MSFAPANLESLGIPDLTRELDRTKSDVFLGKTAAFLGSILCSLNFIWTTEIETAATNGINLWWNPGFFMSCSKELRKTVLMHELWHVARLHGIRRGDRCPDVWNYACDYVINNDLDVEGYQFDGIGLRNPDYFGMVEEDIYDLLNKKGGNSNFPGSFGDGGIDIIPLSPEEKHTVINTVVTAVHQAKMTGAGTVPGGIEEMLDVFLSPVVPWQVLLNRFFTQLLDEDYTWAKPNRRQQDIYLPSRFTDDGRLEKLKYYIDVSGSISRDDVIRFNSELKFVKETFNPEKLIITQFDFIIQREDVWEEDDPFEKIHIVGRGGTSLDCVREDINESKPTAAIIFSDLECSPMQPLDFDVPVIWIVVHNASAKVPFGEKICIHD